MLSPQLQAPWNGAEKEADAEIQRLYGLCRRAGAALAAIETLAAGLEAEATGYEVWRVADAQGAYCIEFSREGQDAVLNPEREARQWFEEHKAYCEARGYTVQRAREYRAEERARLALAAKLRALIGAA